jgi:hypothetical protein
MKADAISAAAGSTAPSGTPPSAMSKMNDAGRVMDAADSLKVFRRVFVGALGARFSLSLPTPTAAGGDHSVADARRGALSQLFALRGAPSGATVRVAPSAIVWMRTDSYCASMLVGVRANSSQTYASVTYVAHEVTADGWHMLVLPNVEPLWRPPHTRPYAYALPHGGGTPERSRAATGNADGKDAHDGCEGAVASYSTHNRALLSPAARRVADFIARSLYNADDA